jgi:hypothetical protein
MDGDLQVLGKEIQFLMRELSDESKASFSAGAILGIARFGTRIPIQMGLSLYQMFFSHPKVIRYLSIGLKSKRPRMRAAAK